jgi:hypothetical protein
MPGVPKGDQFRLVMPDSRTSFCRVETSAAQLRSCMNDPVVGYDVAG